MENHSSEQAALRMRILYQIERDFEEEAAGTIVKIVRLEKDMPAELLNFVQCFRVRNVFFRVLPDSRSGRNYIASLRGILQSDSHLLSVPLSTMFYYRGMPVLAQALVPMTTRPRRLYGANSTNDVEVEAELTFIAEALNIPLPDNSMEVYEALDGRYYVTNSNATLTPLFVDDTIMKRQEMLRVCPEVSEGADNTMEVLDDGALQETVLQICTSSTPATTSAALTQVCEFLHARGVNLCLLKQLVRRLLFASNYDLRAVEQAVQLLSCEMLCRALKQEFYIEIQGKRTAYDELFLTRTLSKYFALVFAPSPQFRAKFLDVVSKKYGITAEDGDLMDILVSFRKEWKQRIMDRVCHLLGATIRKENGVVHVTWRPFANSSVIPRLVEPAVAIQLAAMYSHVRTGPPHSYAFCLPLCCKVACWQRNFSEALSLAHEAATAQEARTGPLQLIRLMMERVVCHVSFQTRDWPCIQDGRSRFPAVLAGYEQWAGPKTQGRRCIEYGFWLVDVAEALMEAPAELRSCVEEAAHYFYKAIARLPAYLRSDHGAWLHLQPYMGLLRCKKLLPSCSVDTRALVQHSVELSKLGWASDFFIDYLRELGRQLEYEGNFADAIQVLLTAISLSKEKPTFTADLHTLLMDVAHIYRSWDLRLHSDACIELTNEAIRYAAQYYGVESREYGVVLNNRGAIEIELGWLDRAEETLRNAGAALNAAGVPHDDPDYVAYVRNLKTLWRRRHPSQPPPTPLSGFLRRFPFLESACKDVPWDDVRPLEDSRFAELARCRAQEADGTNEAYRLEADMKQRAGELFRVLLSGATLKLYPFLPAQLEGVYVEGLLLTYDQIFLELATQWHREPAASPARHLQERLTLAYVSVKARRTADRRAYEHSIEDTFLEVFGASVNALLPVNFSEVVEDAEVQSLMHEYERLKAHNAPAAELGETQARMGQRVHSFELEQWRSRQSISAWVPDGLLHSCFLRDFSRDGALCDLLAARQHAAHTGENVMPHDILEARIAALCMSIWERGQLDRLYCRSESHQLQQRYHLSSPRVHLQPLSDIFEDLLEPWSVSLHTLVNTDDRDRVVAAVHRRGRLNTDAENLEQWYPRLRALQCPTWMLAGLPHRFDPAYQREQLQWQKSDGSNRTAVLAHLSQYLAFIETRAHKARVGVMRCRIRAEAMYPFLDLRYEGVHVLDLALGDDQVFCKDYAEYTRFSSELKLPAGRLKACEGRMRARAVVLAQQLCEREATLQQRFGSYLRSSDPPLQWSSTFIEYTPRVVQCEQYHLTHTMEAIDSKEARHAACCAHKVRSYIRYMSQDQFQRRLVRGSYDEEIAERYPYLTAVPLASVLLSTLPFECRHKFRMLHVTLFAPLRDTEGGVRGNAKSDNAAAPVSAPLFCASLRAYQHKSVATKVRRLVGIVEEMAHEENEAQQRLQKAFPGLPHAILGVPTTQLVFPPNFEQQWSLAAKENFTGLSTQGVYSALVQCAMSARALPLARQYLDELSLTSQPFLLYTTRQCVSLRHLPLRADGKYSALYSDYDALLKLSLPTSPECCLQRVRLAARADQLAMRVTRQWDRLLRQFQQPLTLSDDQLSHLQRHPEILRTAPRAPKGRIPPEAGQKIIEELANHQRQVTEKAIADEQLHADLPFIHPSTSVEYMEKDSTFLLRKNVQQSGRHSSLPGNKDEKAEQERRDYTIDISYEAHITLLRREQNGLAEQHRKADVMRVSKLTEEKNQQNIISRYPFLRLHEEEGWPEALVADEAFARLAAEHADLALDPKRNAAALRGVEDAMNECGDAVAAALRHAALMRDLASRYPFLRLHEEEGWPEALVADEAFARLAAEHADLALDPKRNAAALRGVEDAMNECGDAVAAALRHAALMRDLASRYPFLRLHEEEGWPEALVADEAFARLAAEHADLALDPKRNAAALRGVEDAMNECGDAVAAALRHAALMRDLASRYPFLRLHEEEGWPEALVADEAFARLAAEHADLALDPKRNAAALRGVEDAMNECGDAVAAALRHAALMRDLASRYPFLRLHEEEGWPEALVADEAFARLAAEHADLALDSKRNAAALRGVEDAMNECGDAVAAALRHAALMRDLASRYPFLRLHEEEGWPEALVADEAFARLAAEHADLALDSKRNAAALRGVEDAMNECGDAVAAALRHAALMRDLASRYPFLRLHEEEGWPEALVADEAFARLAAEHADLACDPKKNAAALRGVEDAMNECGDAVAAALRHAALMRDLASRYPFLRLHEEEGWPEALVADEAFARLAAEHADLALDPKRNAAALRGVEDAMNECGDAVAAALRHAALMRDLASRYPLLRLHEEEGWPEALVADEAFARLAAEHADLACDPKKNAAALRGVEDAMNECGDAVAAALRHAALMRDLASRYPFLRLHEEEGWPEALVADEAFARLAAEHADLALDPKRNAAALRGVEDAMNECGDAVAAALRHAALMRDLASRYPFLRLHEEEGWPEALVADEAFARLAAEHADLALDSKRNAAALRGVEDAMNECGDAVAAALRHAALMRDLASRYPFLRLHEEEGWPEALVADEAFARLAAEHADLACDPKRNAAALRGVEDAMNECGDAVAAALRHAALMRDLASRYPFLRLHEEEGWPEALVADEAFARLAAEHADLACDPKRNAAALRGVEDAMNECGDAVAAALRHAALMRDLASRYPFLRLHEEEGWPEALVADEAFARLAAEHADLALDSKRNAAALRGVEDAMNECGDAVAAALRHAALMRDLASRYPFLRLHEEEGWPEALVADEAFARLAAEHADLALDPKRNAAALRGVEDAMNECGDAVAAALRHAALMRDLASRYPFLRLHEEEGWPEALVADEAFARLAAEHADLALDSKRNAAALRGVEDAMNECGDAVAAALRHAALMRDLASRYPFLRLHEEEGWPEALVADEAFARLAAEHADLACDPKRNAAALRGVEDAMNECGDAVAAALRHAALMRDLASRYPFLRLHEEEGWPEALVADEAFARLAAEHADLALDPKRNAAALRGVEDAMNECGDAVAAALRHAALMRDLASRYPFLRLHEEEGWPEALVADEAFARLAAEHADLALDPKRNAAALRGVEDAMNECGDAVAAALRHAALMRDLASRYPFLRLHEEEGWPEALVADEAFARLAAEHADLACDPKRNAAALRGVEDAMNECGDAVAAALRHAALMRDLASRYPFLRLHEEEGWPEALVADEAFARLAAEHADLALDSKRNAAALRGVEDAMNECGDAVAAALRHAALMRDLASRYPFLRLHEEEGWPEALVADEAFARLAAEHADLACDPKKNAAALRGVEDAMNECGDAVAAALRHAALMRDLASRYPFLRLHEEEGWPEALVADEAFARLAAEHADLALDSKRNAAALRGVEDAMNECGDAVAAALRHAALMRDLASRYPFLRLHEEEGWPEALVADEAFARLAAEHADLACDPKRNAAALRGVEDAMNECGDAVAAALRHAALMRDLASRYPFLRLHEEEGWPEALVADEAFARLAAEHADLACDPKKNAAALRGVEDAMNECGDAVAAALRHAALMRDLASRYPFLRLHEEEGWPEALVADEAFARLAAEHADLALDPKRNAAALRGVEDAMNERAVFILALLSEDLFLGLIVNVYDEECACRDVVQSSEVSERCYLSFMAVVEGEDVERFLICSEEMDCFSNLFSCWRSSLCEVSEAVRLRVVVELLDVVKRESAVCVDVYSEEQSCRSDMLLEFIVGVEALRRSNIVAVECTAAERLVDTALCNRIMAEDLLCARAQEALLDCHAAEVKSRGYVVADERADRFNLAVAFVVSDEAVLRRYIQSKECVSATHVFTRASSERQDILRTRHSQIIKSLEMCVQDETVSRSGLEQEETDMRDVLVEDGKRRAATFSALASQRSFLLQEEVLARKDVELHENEVWELLRGEWEQLRENLTAGQLAAAESYMTVVSLEATEHVPPVEERSTDALVSLEISVALLQRVGRGRLLRKKLQRRLENRRRDILKQGVSHILAEEFMERRTIVGDEHLLWQGLRSQCDRAVPLVRYDDPVDLALQNLMMAEESERDNILNDYILAHDVIERAEHKQFLKQNALVWVSEAPDSSDEEVDELLFSGLLQGTYSTLTTRSRKNLSRTHYRGFELDALGRFLLDYEEDIHKMQAKLTDFRHSVAMVHDQLKYARDRAAQEVVRGGTGAIWVPARPLPLADLVRGPSAQYEGKRAPRTQ
ncbi:conserved hypothetical protein [Leishmania braziliensis MHOM/BR/75/M2904]|uniref:Clu domain-containing protein n=1 Tax=Leishmania braziliensis TaxID=5660 RepID=A4H8U3_LEIBR|nr:conserved hypothetical protein [Leishmania braziliensis MHOM/BR/75/M2904]CAM37811.2 conserved hypothetical protein [Leishmania braziliensis MHOM/BR/75/M2904]